MATPPPQSRKFDPVIAWGIVLALVFPPAGLVMAFVLAVQARWADALGIAAISLFGWLVIFSFVNGF